MGLCFLGLSQTKIIDFFGIQKRSGGIGKCTYAQGTLSSLIILITFISFIILCIGLGIWESKKSNSNGAKFMACLLLFT